MTTRDMILDRLPGTAAEIARDLGLTPQAVTLHLRKLDSSGVVRWGFKADKDSLGRNCSKTVWHLVGQRPPRPPDRECAVCARLLGAEKFHRGREGYSGYCKECSATNSAACAEYKRTEDRLKAHVRRALRVDTSDSARKLLAEYAAVVAGDPCSYCGGEMTVLDHIEPLSKNGLHRWDNLTPCCGSCNSKKSNNTLLEFLGSLADS